MHGTVTWIVTLSFFSIYMFMGLAEEMEILFYEQLSFVSYSGSLRTLEIFVTTYKWDGMSKSRFLLFLANCEICVHAVLMRSKSCKSVLQCTALMQHVRLNNL